jgi:hypothetical protein
LKYTGGRDYRPGSIALKFDTQAHPPPVRWLMDPASSRGKKQER